LFRIFDVVCSLLALLVHCLLLSDMFSVSVVVNWLWWRHLPINLITYFPFLRFVYLVYVNLRIHISCVYISLVHLIHVIVYHACYFNWTLIIKFILIVFIQLVYDNELLLHCNWWLTYCSIVEFIFCLSVDANILQIFGLTGSL